MAIRKRDETRSIVALSLLTGIAFWVLDSFFEYKFFHENLRFLLLEGPESFLDSLLFRIPVHSLFVRVFFAVCALMGGLVLAAFLKAKRASDEARLQSETQYRSIFETVRDALIVYNPKDRSILEVNQAACDLYGYSRSEMRQLKHEDVSAEPDGSFLTSDPNTTWIPRQLHRNRNGETIPTEISVSFSERDGEPVCFAVIRDVSQRERLEREKRELQERLHRSRKMEALGTLAGGVAHDLNNILSPLVAYPDLLLMDLPPESPLKTPLLTIKKSGQKAADIVQDLLTLARRGVLATQVVQLNDVISEYFSSLEFRSLQAAHPQVRFDIQLDERLLSILGSPVHLLKTVMNLVSNAAEAISGSGTITISTRNEYIDRPIAGYEDVREGDYVVLQVIDTGVGISSEDMARIFEPFYTKKVMGRSGTGLGMAVVWGTVKDHQGYIDIQSTQGRGTVCSLYFPVTRKVVDNQTAEGDMVCPRGCERILVVDDVLEQRQIVSTILERLGYEVICASSGEEAVTFLEKQDVDLVILDMIMDPGMDGLDTYRRIIELHPGQKAIIASGFAETERVREAQRLGAGAYIRKPYVIQALAQAVRKELDRNSVMG